MGRKPLWRRPAGPAFGNSPMRIALSVCVLFLAGTSALGAADQADRAETIEASIVPRPVGSRAWQRYVEDGWDSPFGLDYVFPLDREFRKPDLARQLGGLVGV